MISSASMQRALARMQRESAHPHHWVALVDASCQPERIHVIPAGDLREHVGALHCWCHPTQVEDMPAVWEHTSMDGREAFESGERRLS